MRILWSLPVRGERLNAGRGDLVRAHKLIEALRTAGHQVFVVEPGARLAVAVYRQGLRRWLPRRLALVLRDAGRWVASMVQARKVWRAAREREADVIVETQVAFTVSGARAAKRAGRPLVLDDCSPSSEEEALGTGLAWLARRTLRSQARAASWVMASSRAAAASLADQGLPREKIRILPNGTDPRAYTGLDRQQIKRRLGLEQCCVLGFAGSFQPWHATERLVAAVAALRSEPQVHLLLVGDGPARERTLRLVREFHLEKRVTFAGALDPARVPEFIAAFDIGVLPGSNDYGHPMKLLEYAAAGIPIVAPDLPPVREVVREGETGLLFLPRSLTALIAVLRRLIQNPALRQHLGQQARAGVERGAEWAARAQDLAAVLELLLERRQAHPLGKAFPAAPLPSRWREQ